MVGPLLGDTGNLVGNFDGDPPTGNFVGHFVVGNLVLLDELTGNLVLLTGKPVGHSVSARTGNLVGNLVVLTVGYLVVGHLVGNFEGECM